MNEKKSVKEKSENEPTEVVENIKKNSDVEITEDSWAEDQEKKSYYYDDSYGYKIYNPDDDNDDEED